MKTITHFKHIFALVAVLFFTVSFAKAAEPATLVGISLNYDKMQVTIQVVGSGCTQSSDFKFELKDNILTVVRLKMDFCKAMPEVVSFTYSLKDAGIEANKSFTIANKFITNPNLANIGK
jgi:hypothetical protein